MESINVNDCAREGMPVRFYETKYLCEQNAGGAMLAEERHRPWALQ